MVIESGNGKDRDVLHNGNKIPRLAIEPYIFPDLETLSRSLSLDDLLYTQPTGLGRCHQLMTELESEVVADFLDRAGDERLVAKMQRLKEQARQADLEQVFYQAVMMALGSGPSKTLYYLLAKRTPPREMMNFVRDLPRTEWITGLEALLMHIAGLAPDEESLADAPEDARRGGDSSSIGTSG